MMSRVGLLAAVAAMMMGSVAIGERAAAAAGSDDAEEPVPAGEPGAPAPRLAAPPAAVEADPATEASASAKALPSTSPSKGVFGVGLRVRYVSVPGWLLGFFTKHNMPLSTVGHYGIEGFRRRGNVQLGMALSYQNMSPPDGNWLGTGRSADVDTRFLQFRGLSLYSADISILWQGMISSWFGLHAGAGLGLAVVRGTVYLNTSDGCTETNIGDLSQCHPPGVTCANGVCTPVSALSHTPNGDVLPVLPIINLVAGVDFRVPDVKGWEAKLDFGFYDAFFAGAGVAYTF